MSGAGLGLPEQVSQAEPPAGWIIQPDALHGIAVAAICPDHVGREVATRLLDQLAACGAASVLIGEASAGPGPAPMLGLLVIVLDGAVTLAAMAASDLASRLVAAFATARDSVRRMAPGGCVLFALLAAAPPARSAISAMCRSLALEWAPAGIRVNALTCARHSVPAELTAFLAGPASAMLTGAILDVA
jgi:NAD(P)-dependent dehydrogenase (short-subunit alcohol dehydrogenase family)